MYPWGLESSWSVHGDERGMLRISIVLELGAIVTSNCLDLTVMLTLSFFGKVDEGYLSFIFSLEKEHPCISCIVLDNDKAIPPTSQTIIRWRPKEIQVNELERPQSGNDS